MRILDFKPSLQIASQSARDCSEAAGEVSSMYSTPKASRALAMAILVLVSKKAFANCSPSGEVGKTHQMHDGRERVRHKPRRVLSMILKLETLERKSAARGAYGLRFSFTLGVALLVLPRLPLVPLAPLAWARGTSTMSALSTTAGAESPFA